MATSKKKSAKNAGGYRVSYWMYWESSGKWRKHVTAIVYKTRQEAQKYADQLNKGKKTKNARVRKA